MQDRLYQAVRRWKAAWRELQSLEAGGTIRKDREQRIAVLREQIARLQPLVNEWKSRTYFGGKPPVTYGVGGLDDAVKRAGGQ